MAVTDVPPPDCPPWLLLAHIALITMGVLFWDATYILMTRRALATKSYGMPLLALSMNVSWELVIVFFCCETILDQTAFLLWLVLDIGLVYTTIRFGPNEWRQTNPWIGQNIGCILAVMTAFGCVGQYTFTIWWLSEPGIGFGTHEGKSWRGIHEIDTSQLTFWTAGVAQLVLSAGSIAMLLVRGHSGGTGYLIWFCRFMGTVFGMVLNNLLMWWYWPAAYVWIVHPFAVFLWASSIACDVAYPFLLWHVRKSEIQLPDGSLMRRDSLGASREQEKKTK